MSHGFLIAAPSSGSGKTTVCLAIMAALTRRGMAVAPFKCGPDFIDPGYHQAVTGQVSINLDEWMCGEQFVRERLNSAFKHNCCAKPTIAIIEGVMGLFDGFGSGIMDGSSAKIAAITKTPVVLVVNAAGMAGSAAALVKGFVQFSPLVNVAGVIFNNVGSESHAALLKDVIALHCPEIVCFGTIVKDEALSIQSRHLGLVTACENQLPTEFVEHLVDVAERYLDLNWLARLEIPSDNIATNLSNSRTKPEIKIKIAVASDAAFCFCYEDNLRLLELYGAEILFFSPLYDRELPKNVSGIYLPGGYPELYSEKLSANWEMRMAIKNAVEQFMPVYAECGGFIYLTQGMFEGADFAGVFPVRTRMLNRRKALGYREVVLNCDTLIGNKGEICRGHEFHYSEIEAMPESVDRCYMVSRRGKMLALEGYRVKKCLGSYIHLHFASNISIAKTFVDECFIYSQAM